VLESKAGIGEVYLEQLYTFGDPDRDPRTRVVTVAYYALVEAGRLLRAEGGQEGVILARIEVPWQGEAGGPVVVRDRDGAALAVGFDHADILGLVVKRMRGKLDYTAIGFELLPQRFTLRQLQEVHEAILGRRLNKDSFRRRVLALGLVDPTGERERGVEHRPAELYRFRTST
jgi:8-oxo-dGTP diphosphatase